MSIIVENSSPQHLFIDPEPRHLFGRGAARKASPHHSPFIDHRLMTIQHELEIIRADLHHRIDTVKKAINEALQD